MISSVTLLSLCFLFVALQLFTRWRKRILYENVPGPEPSTGVGYLLDLHDPKSTQWHHDIPEKYGHVARLKGPPVIGSDALYVTDPLALHTIIVKEQNWFRESEEFAGLFGIIHHGDGVASVHGQEHRKQRKLMDKTLTAAKVAQLTDLFYGVGKELVEGLSAKVAATPNQPINILDHLIRTALELIARGGIGHTFHSFDEGGSGVEFETFYGAISGVLVYASRLFIVLPFLQFLRHIRPVWLRRSLAKIVHWLPWPAARNFRFACDTMHSVFKHVFDEKKYAVYQGRKSGVGGGHDFVTNMIKLNMEVPPEERLPDDVIIANMSGLVHGGQETTSGALARLIDLMAQRPETQAALREEVAEAYAAKGGADLDYYELNALPLMDAVIRETLRVFAPVTFVWRQTIRDMVVPVHFPVIDPRTGESQSQITIQQGTFVYIGLGAANKSKAIWGADAKDFNPNRWLGVKEDGTGKGIADWRAENAKLPGVYSNSMSFLGGGRACPGMKFALLEIKLILALLIRNFVFEPAYGIDLEWQLGITLEPRLRGKENEGVQVPVIIRRLK